jgi:hypothetical protein
MNAPRPVLLGLVALANTAIWAALLHLGSRALGFPLKISCMGGISAVIFMLTMLILAMVTASSNGNSGANGANSGE